MAHGVVKALDSIVILVVEAFVNLAHKFAYALLRLFTGKLRAKNDVDALLFHVEVR